MTINVDDIDLTDTSIYRNGFPHDIFTALRDQAPVWRHPDCPGLKDVGGESFVVLSRSALTAIGSRTLSSAGIARWSRLKAINAFP